MPFLDISHTVDAATLTPMPSIPPPHTPPPKSHPPTPAPPRHPTKKKNKDPPPPPPDPPRERKRENPPPPPRSPPGPTKQERGRNYPPPAPRVPARRPLLSVILRSPIRGILPCKSVGPCLDIPAGRYRPSFPAWVRRPIGGGPISRCQRGSCPG